MRSFKSRIPGFISFMLALCVLLGTGVQAKGQPIDYSLRGLNEEFYAAFTKLLDSQDTSDFFGTIQIKIGEAKLVKDGDEYTLDAAPETIQGRTMLPIRAVAEAAGMSVVWDEASRTVTVSDAYGSKVTASIGSDTITVNGEARKIDATPYIKDGCSFFPVRTISEALNLDVAYDKGTHTVTLTAPYQTARLLVMTNDDLSAKSKSLNAKVTLHDGAGMWILQFSTPAEAKEAANVLRGNSYQPEPDIYVVTRSAESERVYGTKQSSWGALDCNFADFTAKYTERFQERVTVAVVDTGVDAAHPALQGRLRPGRDFVENDNEPEDEDSHGTHVAATILDCVGDAPVDILPVRVVAKDGGSSSSRLSQGIRYAADRYAKVINVSLGGALDAEYQFSNGQQVLDSAIQYALKKGAVVVVSAGNDNADTLYYCPANIERAGVVVVTAGDETHSRWPQSNYGEAVDLMAPGTNIIAAIPGGGYAAKSGTSMAAPHVSAAAALLCLSSGNTIKPGALEKALCSATKSGAWQDAYTGYGFLDLSRGKVPEYRPAKVFKNVLMPDRCIVSNILDAPEYPVFGSKIKRKEIASVTFQSSKSGIPTKRWDVSKAQDGSIVAWTTSAEDGLYNLVIAADGVIGAPADCSRMFYGYSNVTNIRFNNNFDTANVTDMSWMFHSCSKLTGLDVSGWDTSNVTDMGGLFSNCTGLTELDVSGWDTANITDMGALFSGCRSLTGLDVSGWDTSNVTDMGGLFSNCTGLTELDVSGWDTSNVTDMGNLFSHCTGLTELDVSGWDTSSVTNMWGVFSNCSGLTALDVSSWDTSNVTDMNFLFYKCPGLTTLDVSGWDTSNVTDMMGLFSDCTGLTVLDVSGWDTSNVTEMTYLFSDCTGLTELDVSGWDTSAVTRMVSMFINCSALAALDVSGWDTSSVTNMLSMFANCSALAALDVSGWDTSAVTDMGRMFSGCRSLTALDVSGWDLSNVASIESTFYGCPGLASLDLSGSDFENLLMAEKNDSFVFGSEIKRDEIISVTFLDSKAGMPAEHWDVSELRNGSVVAWVTPAENGLYDLFIAADGVIGALDCSDMFSKYENVVSIAFGKSFDTENVSNMSGMFYGCSSLASLDRSDFNTRNVTSMRWMFTNCSSLTSLDVSGWDTSKVTLAHDMFSGCTGLTALDVSGWNTSRVTNMGGMFDGCSGLSALDVSGWNTSSVTSMSHTFNGCSGLSVLDVSGWNTSKVSYMWGMFAGCTGLTALDVGGFDISSVTDIRAIFNGCSGLSTLDVSDWDTSSVVSMKDMFNGCTGLTSLDVSNWDTSNVRDMGNMFEGCTGLHGKLGLSGWDTSKVEEGNGYTLP